jgi:hypothetical protein
VRQSDSRVPGRPPSFGRAESEGLPVEDMTVRGGQALHLVLHLDVTPSQQSLDKLHEAIAATTKDAVLAGYAAAFTVMDDGADGAPVEQPGGGGGGAPPGPTLLEEPDGCG